MLAVDSGHAVLSKGGREEEELLGGNVGSELDFGKGGVSEDHEEYQAPK
jgi:hypothetical protein